MLKLENKYRRKHTRIAASYNEQCIVKFKRLTFQEFHKLMGIFSWPYDY